MSVTGPHDCPTCQADLSEVGPAGRCPRCGFEFDEHTLIWRSAYAWQHFAAIYGVAGLVTGLVVAISQRIAIGHAENALLPIITALVVGAGGLVLHRVLSGRLSDRFVAVAPAGIVLGLRGGTELIPWDDVRRVTVRSRLPRLERHSTSIAVILEDVFENEQELAAFREHVAGYKERRSKSLPAGSSNGL